VGYGQLHERLRQDGRVRSMERVNARALPEGLGPVDVLVADVSFISLALVIPGAWPLLTPSGHAVLLVKPQFECGREWVEKGGVVRDEGARRRAVDGVRTMLAGLGGEVLGDVESPIPGPAGNVEFLIAARRGVS
jgi:23S rRNA (cytidine1920-2'-O)/16S rRNA (cytidine1409-2'-O)-methyltransferase